MLPLNKVSHGRIPKAFVAKAWWRGSSQRQQTQSTASHHNSADPPIVSQHTLHTREGERRNKAKLMKSFEWLLFSEHTHTLKPKNCPRRTHAHIPHFQLIIAIETLICCCYLHILPHQVGWFCCGVTSATSRGRRPIPYHPASCKPKKVYILLSETIKKRFSIS